jgi:predicted PurR-regulated permease PerM
MDDPTAARNDQPPPIDTAALRRQAVFWLAATLVFIGFVYLFRSILLPFVAGMILAYFLDPVADWLERLGLSRALATALIVFGFLIAFVLALMLVIPILASQLAEFINRIPAYVARLQLIVTNFDPNWISQAIGVDPGSLREGLSGLLTQAAGFLTGLFHSIWSSGRALIDIAGLFVITPVVAFYMLLDWDRMVARVDNLIPRDHLQTVRAIAADIDRSLAGFVRGQGTLCLLLGVYYALGLTLVGVNFGLLIGLFAGLVSFIPYVGAVLGLVLAVGVALVQFWPEWHLILLVASIFVFGQLVEGNILQPRLVGRSVGLHPVWLIFALFAFGSLFGFVGLLIAVPAAAAIGVLVRFALSRYLVSPYYTGASGRKGAEP